MTDVRASNAVLQVVHSGATGSNLGVTFATLQSVLTLIAARVRVSNATLQTVRGGSSAAGARLRDTAAYLQSVYTTGAPNTTRQLAWTFELDGHMCYVLDLATNGTLIFDKTTGQWYHFETAGYDGHWNMKNGFHWLAGRKIVGGDIASSKVWNLDKAAFLDEGWRPVVYEIRGALFSEDNDYKGVYALRLIGAAGRTADDETPVVYMQFSDDEAATWSNTYTIELTSDKNQRVEWTSLGSFAAPGRIFRIFGPGGAKYIGYVVADVEE